MKKIGFTLSEALMTLGIIGVVAAFSAPALIQHVGSSRIGPSLGKARNTFENATQMMLSERRLSNLNQINNWIGQIPQFMRVVVDGNTLFTEDNMSYTITDLDVDFENIPNAINTVTIDINVARTERNHGQGIMGINQFMFILLEDGSLKPVGGRGSGLLWSDEENGCNARSVGNARTCAGSIFENDMRVIYELDRAQSSNNNNN